MTRIQFLSKENNQSKTFIANKVPFSWIARSEYTFLDHKNSEIMRATEEIQLDFHLVYILGYKSEQYSHLY
ncbi:MAG: hypothetical protein ACFE95_20340 [Candidatus Hodarchaeota archaeon]